MDISGMIKLTQEQAVAAWGDHLNQLRVDELMRKLFKQDINLEDALKELETIKKFIASPEHILGSNKSKHGEIAEYMQVYISNARRYVKGLMPEYTFNGVGRTAPEDYLRNGIEIQSKFMNGSAGTFYKIMEHLKKYPDFIKNGGEYDIPKDQYDFIINILSKPASQLSRSDYTLEKNIKSWEIANGVSFADKVNPSVVDYANVQIAVAGSTVDKEKANIEKIDQSRRDEAYRQSKPSLKQGAQAAVASAAAEGGISLCLGVAQKIRVGKKLNDFTEDDWKEVGIDTAKGTGKGVEAIERELKTELEEYTVHVRIPCEPRTHAIKGNEYQKFRERHGGRVRVERGRIEEKI